MSILANIECALAVFFMFSISLWSYCKFYCYTLYTVVIEQFLSYRCWNVNQFACIAVTACINQTNNNWNELKSARETSKHPISADLPSNTDAESVYPALTRLARLPTRNYEFVVAFMCVQLINTSFLTWHKHNMSFKNATFWC